MAYEGFLVKIGDYVIDENRFIQLKSYKFRKNFLDLNSKRTGMGNLIRNTLPHPPIELSFTIPPGMSNHDIKELFDEIEKNYLPEAEPEEQKVLVTAYYPKKDSYETQEMYLVEPEFTLTSTYRDIIIYEAVQVEFVGY